MSKRRQVSELPWTTDPGDATLSRELRVPIDSVPSPPLSGTARRNAPFPSVDALPRGFVVGNYEVESLIDMGGGGAVYAVRHRLLGRRAALKALREEVAAVPSMIARFEREAATVNKIQHPNIVDIYEFGEIAPGRPYYIMELLEGTDLRKLLRERGRFSAQETLDLFEPICSAVQAAHDAGIVHRDIKASNIIIVTQAGARVVKLVDFGIAKPIGEPKEQGLTEPGLLIGTAHNMAPEHVRGGALDARTDVYALGILAFQLLTGHYPFDASDPAEIAMQHLQKPPPRPSASAPVSPSIDSVVLRCLEKVPDKRFGSVSEMLETFRAAVDGSSGAVGRAEWAVGIYFEVTIDTKGEMDDAMLADVGNVLDTIEQGLSSSSFVFPFRTSNALLGVRAVGSETEAARVEEEVEAILSDWHRILAERPDRDAAVRVTASLSTGQALCRRVGGNVEVLGGPLLDFDVWKDEGRVWAG
jgi:serine/threonine-protein kinase